MTVTAADLRLLVPEVVVAAVAVAVLLAGVLLPESRQGLVRWLAIGGVAAGGGAVLAVPPAASAAFGGSYVRDALTVVLQGVVLVGTLLALVLSGDYVRRTRLDAGEFYALVVAAAVGAMLMAASADLMLLFVGLETLSVPLYVLAALARADVRSQEAGLKYFLLGAFASAFFLYGVALAFGATGSTTLAALAAAPPSATGRAAVALLTTGLAFKAAVVPFHVWAPDVYEGAPLPVTAYMAVVAKAGAFAAFLRVFVATLGPRAGEWAAVLAAAAVLTMVVGNVAALHQTGIKRLLAYSSIAHAGFLLTGVLAASPAGAAAVVFYLLAYTFMTLGAFAVVLMVRRADGEADRIADLAGLASRSPALGAAMAVFMAALTGLPPTAGFAAKFFVFTAALDAGYTGVVVVGVLSSVVSAYYYLRVASTLFSGAPAPGVVLVEDRWVPAALAVAAVGTVLLGVFPTPVLSAVQQVAAVLR
jgi:NADH-quinone oxidoreductase subunit N